MAGLLQGNTLIWIIPIISFLCFILSIINKNSVSRISLLNFSASFINVLLFLVLLFTYIDDGELSSQIVWAKIGDTTLSVGATVDALSISMLGLISIVTFLVKLYSIQYMRSDAKFGWYFSCLSLFSAAMYGVVLSDNLLFLYGAWELVGLGSYLLIGFWYEKRAAAEAAKKAFITTRIGDVGLLIGSLILFKLSGTFNISEIFHVVTNGVETKMISESTVALATTLIALGAIGKSAQFPLHVWLPDAMEGPTPASALIHAATMVAAGVFLVARLFPIFEVSIFTLTFIATIGITTFLIAGTLALAMKDLKRILAYSTVSHLGLMFLSLGCGNLPGAIFHLLIHGASKALLFLCAGNFTSLTGKSTIFEMSGKIKIYTLTSCSFLIGSATLAGIPPLGGFWSKDAILVSAYETFGIPMLIAALLGAFLSAFYITRMVTIIFSIKKPSHNQVNKTSLVMSMPTIILAAFSVLLIGLLLNWGDQYLGFSSFLSAAKETDKHHVGLWIPITSALVTVLAVILSWMKYTNKIQLISNKKVSTLLENKYHIDNLYNYIVSKIVLRTSKMISAFDRIVINDTGVDGLASLIPFSSLKIKHIQTGKISTYLMSMTIGLVAILLYLIFFN
ncbi:MAG: NADH-quinone oxidoreductase subunit L [SAR202 cluster bacterium]|nr:NADH-quinone oxidoreductase subunit L [SAR202 cluster bacterium]|tara:strand:- start:28169 stop:30034 length:1866 start_codon:yes stop_codon:yes gene_type:complete